MKSLVTKTKLKKGTVLFVFSGKYLHKEQIENFRYPLQINENVFLESPHDHENYINHSCKPNCFINFSTMELITLKTVKPEEEITFDYCATEYDLIEQKGDFTCNCGYKSCRKQISGFKYLSKKQKNKLKPYLSPFLLYKLSQDQEAVQVNIPTKERQLIHQFA